jgi:hypothetical protein
MDRDIIVWNGHAIDLNSIVSIELPVLYTSSDGAMSHAHVAYRIHTSQGTVEQKTYFDFLSLPYRMRDESGNRLDNIQWGYVDGTWHSILGSYCRDEQVKAIADAMKCLEPLMVAWGKVTKPRCLTDGVTDQQ